MSLCLLAGCCHSWASAVEHIYGEAFDLNSNALVYTEEHIFVNSNQKVVYKEPDGSVFANKTLDYSHSLLVPDVWQLNERIDETIDLRKVGSGYLQAKYLRGDKNIDKSKTLMIEHTMVADAGFNTFVLQNWDELAAGSTEEFLWFVPSRLKPIRLQVSSAECADGGHTCFTIRPSNWLLGLALKPIKITYDSGDRQLLRYEGRSNIAAPSGEYHSVRIEYSYHRAE